MKHKRVDYKSGLILFIGVALVGLSDHGQTSFKPRYIFFIFWDVPYFVSILLMLRDKLKPLSLSNMTVIKRSFTDNEGITVTINSHHFSLSLLPL